MNPDNLNAEQAARQIAHLWPELYEPWGGFVLTNGNFPVLWDERQQDHLSLDALAPAEATMIAENWSFMLQHHVAGSHDKNESFYMQVWFHNSDDGGIKEAEAPTEALARARALLKAKEAMKE